MKESLNLSITIPLYKRVKIDGVDYTLIAINEETLVFQSNDGWTTNVFPIEKLGIAILDGYIQFLDVPIQFIE